MQPHQFVGYSSDYPATDTLKKIAADVCARWYAEQVDTANVYRVLPREYVYFTGDGKRNYLRQDYEGGTAKGRKIIIKKYLKKY